MDEPDNLTLRYLCKMDAKLDRLAEDVRELKERMTAAEERMATGFSHLELTLVQQARRLDSLDERLARLERRADLIEDAAEPT